MLGKVLNLLAVRPFKSIMFDWAADVYTTVGKTYDLLLDTVENSSNRNYFDSLYDLASIIYVLMGIFMLFRITVSFLNMLIDPDKVNDKQAGATSIIKRVFISLVLLIVFQPDSFMFKFLGDVEDALINETIPNITAQIGTTDTNYDLNNLLVSDVDAASGKTFECIYIHKKEVPSTLQECSSGTCTYFSVYDHDYVIKLKISDTEFSGSTNIVKPGVFNNLNSGWYVQSMSGSATDSDGNKWNFATSLVNGEEKFVATDNIISSYFENGKCPTYINQPSSEKLKFVSSVAASNTSHFVYSTLNEIQNTIVNERNAWREKANAANVSLEYSGENADSISEAEGVEIEARDMVISYEALPFAQGAFRSFIDVLPEGEGDAAVNERLNNLLKSSAANDEVFDLATDSTPKISISYFLAIITGFVIIGYLLLLCVEVIIRNFKLILLEVMAPIPIISYIDPKDKIFGNWLKTYFTVFVDLFIKLVVIKIGVGLLTSVLQILADEKGFIKLLYLLAVLIFMKAIPELIKKIFGFDMSGSSFKEIGKMAKKGLSLATAGVGGVIGLGVGAATGKGWGRVSGALSGAFRGMGSGYKGKVFGGAQSVAQKNALINDAKANGLDWWDRTAAVMLGQMGYSPKTRLDNQIKETVDKQKMLDEWRKQKDNVEAMAEKTAAIEDLKTKVANGQLSKENYKAIRKAYIQHIDSGSRDAFDFSSVKDSFGNELTYMDGSRISGSVAYDRSNFDKVTHAIDNLKTTYASNTSLQRELQVAENAAARREGRTAINVTVDNYSQYLASEANATAMRNQYETEIIGVQQSDEYIKAQSFEAFSNKSGK